MGKGGKSLKKGDGNPVQSKRKLRDEYSPIQDDDMDDKIDAFHKQRDIIPLDVNEEDGDSNEDNEQPVFGLENIHDDNDDDDVVDEQDTGFSAKIVRQQKFLREKFGAEDEMHDDEENKEEEKPVWGGKKQNYYGVDNGDFEQKSSDDESAEEEEAEVVRLQKERAKFSTLDDYGLDDIWEHENDEELTFEEISMKGNSAKRFPVGIDLADGTGTAY